MAVMEKRYGRFVLTMGFLFGSLYAATCFFLEFRIIYRKYVPAPPVLHPYLHGGQVTPCHYPDRNAEGKAHDTGQDEAQRQNAAHRTAPTKEMEEITAMRLAVASHEAGPVPRAFVERFHVNSCPTRHSFTVQPVRVSHDWAVCRKV
jgi:hypothetical protein